MKPLRTEEIEVQTVQLVRITSDPTPIGDAGAAGQTRRSQILRRLPFLIIVMLPTALAVIYFLVFASARYQSEVKFVVRSPASSATSELASLVSGSSGVTRGTDDAFIAKEYMESRDAMTQLIQKDNLQGMFNDAGTDLLWRPTFFEKANQEGLLKHYLRFISVEYDQGSGITTLLMQAFKPEDAQRLASALLDHTETFLNSLNGRAQADAVQAALADVEQAKQRAYAALDQVTGFRNRETVIDPTKSSTGIVTSISTLSLEVATTNARLSELLVSTPQSPELASLRSRIAALQDQITKQRQQLGGSSSSLAPRIADYERLLLDQQFAERTFMSALTSLESARIDSERQRVFLERVTQPDLPDFPAYPYRLLSILATFACSYLVYRILSVLAKDVIDHGKQ